MDRKTARKLTGTAKALDRLGQDLDDFRYLPGTSEADAYAVKQAYIFLLEARQKIERLAKPIEDAPRPELDLYEQIEELNDRDLSSMSHR